MNLEHICYGCFREKTNDSSICPYCGFDNAEEQPFLALGRGTILNGRYMVGKVLGIGGFGITYLGYDMTLEIEVAIKEYMPSGLVTRHADRYNVTLTTKETDQYTSGMERFLEEARILAKLQNTPNIVSVQNYFKENNTAYFVMEFVDGVSLKSYLASQGGKIPYEQALTILLPVMQALTRVHAMNLTHRDISPDNISITSKGESKLLDFGAARFSSGDDKSVSVILKHGYAPEEQYSSRGNQGPWTDVYAMGATMYRCITGELPPDSISRIHNDTLKKPSELGVQLPVAAEKAIMKALSIKAEDRFQTMDTFEDALMGKKAAKASKAAKGSDRVKKEKKKVSPALRITIVVLLVIVCVMRILNYILEKDSDTYSQSNTGTSGGTSTGISDISSVPDSESPDISDVQFWDYTSNYLNMSISIPEGFVEEEDEFESFRSESKARGMKFDYITSLGGMPIYSLGDAKKNAEVGITSYAYNQRWRDCVSYEILSQGDRKIGDLDAYEVVCTVTFKDPEVIDEYRMIYIEGQNGYGCYRIVGDYGPDEDLAREAIAASVETFKCNGPAGTVYEMFADDALPYHFIYWDDSDSIEFERNSENTLVIYSTEDDSTYIEIYYNPRTSEMTAEAWMDNSVKVFAENLPEAIQIGTRATYSKGGVSWMMDKYEYTIDGTKMYIGSLSGEVEDYVFSFLFMTDDRTELTTNNMLYDILESIRPVN